MYMTNYLTQSYQPKCISGKASDSALYFLAYRIGESVDLPVHGKP